ncbi:MAG: hypothetical protein KJ063_24970, partial [Anaerolineae bacterium]|nr:hypothetical protein [Anaerolineae bacterium]
MTSGDLQVDPFSSPPTPNITLVSRRPYPSALILPIAKTVIGCRSSVGDEMKILVGVVVAREWLRGYPLNQSHKKVRAQKPTGTSP